MFPLVFIFIVATPILIICLTTATFRGVSMNLKNDFFYCLTKENT